MNTTLLNNNDINTILELSEYNKDSIRYSKRIIKSLVNKDCKWIIKNIDTNKSVKYRVLNQILLHSLDMNLVMSLLRDDYKRLITGDYKYYQYQTDIDKLVDVHLYESVMSTIKSSNDYKYLSLLCNSVNNRHVLLKPMFLMMYSNNTLCEYPLNKYTIKNFIKTSKRNCIQVFNELINKDLVDIYNLKVVNNKLIIVGNKPTYSNDLHRLIDNIELYQLMLLTVM